MDAVQHAMARKAPLVADTREAWLEIPATAPDKIAEFKRYNNAHRQMVPRFIQAEWRRRNGDPWEINTLIVHGNPLKKDGTPAVTETECQVVAWGKYEQDCPTWLSVAINGIQPT